MSRIERACDQAIRHAEGIFRQLERQVPAPVLVDRSSGRTWRYAETLPEQAILLKCGRAISAIRAAWLLLSNGFVQEVGTIFRSLDEIVDDVIFLSGGMRPGQRTKDHELYLQYFWDEANDERGPPVQRKKIRAYNIRTFHYDDKDTSTADSVGRKIYATYSMFVHARGVVLMEMIDGGQPLIALAGQGDHARQPFYENIVHYAHNCLMALGFAANVIGKDDTPAIAYQAVCLFEKEYGDLVFPEGRQGQY